MKSQITNRMATVLISVCAGLMALIMIALVGYIFYQGLGHVTWHFLTTVASTFQVGGGIKDQLWNSFYLLIVTMIFTTPLGIAGGIYLSEYAKPNRVTGFIRSCVEVLASLPSIVVGLFGMLVFVNTFHWGYSILSGAVALTIFNLPVIVRVTEDALRSVPVALKEASFGLGVGQWYTIKNVLLPAAFPGILTGIILSAGRVFGESAALLFTAGLTSPDLDFKNWSPFAFDSPLNPLRSAETLSVHIYSVNTVAIVKDAPQVAAASAAVLALFVLIFNLSARGLGAWIQKRMSGKS
ncbi:putative ABC transporter permease protein YqgI [Pullulanibacillus camelliae]|uniref:Phosphate transport system permease protein PstA n=1 Tax=Pullulanibacillus camelliae TaxID=1707096 RepID=A0A8J2VQL9_9BACL|nr:phosphate ABC transporter permease PstA [Pullulanibacillus camelliae]GGE37204.1 putative ABC transporter permease protein YqgI [Pullulanibacillus camelliae]